MKLNIIEEKYFKEIRYSIWSGEYISECVKRYKEKKKKRMDKKSVEESIYLGFIFFRV